jgi:NADPH:quinone reductase-like Zn-dependent oxidoreductase
MRAWQVGRHGEPADVLRAVTIDAPDPGPGEVRVRVAAAALDMPEELLLPVVVMLASIPVQ